MEKELKSECCNAKVEIGGGGYDGEDIIPTYQWCTGCHNGCAIKKDSRPKTEEIPF